MHVQEVKEEGGKPTIQIKVADQSQKTFTFILKRKTKLSKLFKEYSSRAELNAHKLRFVHKGVTLTGDETADSLGLTNDGLLEVFSSQVGG